MVRGSSFSAIGVSNENVPVRRAETGLCSLVSRALAQFKVGVTYDFGQGITRDYDEAVRWIRLAADQGRARAQTNLGIRYRAGLAGITQDYCEAARCIGWPPSRDLPKLSTNSASPAPTAIIASIELRRRGGMSLG